MKQKAHKTVTMVIDGEEVQIDTGVKELIELLNGEESSIATFACCQGNMGMSYVAFTGMEDAPGAAIDFIVGMTLSMDLARDEFNPKPKRGQKQVFSFHIEMTEHGYIMRWFPSMYGIVLNAAKEALQFNA